MAADEAERVLRRHGLWGKGIVVAVSGGVDSVCLARVAAELATRGLGRVELAHVDHALRPESARDEAFCRHLAEELGVRFHSTRLDPAGRTGNVHAWARQERRAFLETVRARRGLGAVALAHHADDQAETVLFRLIRGAGPRGLAAMDEWSPPFVRPFLGVWRADLEGLARARGWAWRDDPSNACRRFSRSRIRHEVLPLLEAVHPGAKRALVRAARLIRRDEEALSEWARGVLDRCAVAEPEGVRLRVSDVAVWPEAVRFRVYLALWERLGGEPARLDLAHLEAVDGLLGPPGPHRQAPVPGPLRVCRSGEDLWFLARDPGPPAPEVHLSGPGDRLDVPGRGRLEWGTGKPPPDGWIAVPDGRGAGGLGLRPRRAGDRIQRSGRWVKVKDVLMEARIPPWRRDRIWVVTDREGSFGLIGPGVAVGPDEGPSWVVFRAGDPGGGSPASGSGGRKPVVAW